MKNIAEEIKDVYPEYTSYEDAYAMAMDEFYPIKYVLIGMTRPFPSYKNKRPPTKKHCIFEYVLSGKGHIYIEGEWRKLSAGDMYIIGKYDERNIYSDETDPIHKLWISFSSEYIDTMLLHYVVGSGVYRADVKEYFEELYGLISKNVTQREKLFTVAENIHKIILSAADSRSVANVTNITKIENELIASVYTKTSLEKIASDLFMSKANLIRRFKKYKGLTPYQFLLEERLKIAKALLSTTNMSVRSIAEKLCFSDEHYFSHLFKEKVGLSPLKYKAQKTMRNSTNN